jgi:hypothetical protein
MSVPPILQPAGSAAMQGSSAAVGTAWALRIIEWPVPVPLQNSTQRL